MTKLTKKAIGFRLWRLIGDELRPANDHLPPWRLSENRAQCERAKMLAGVWLGFASPDLPDHEAPHPDCGCGFYAWHSPERFQTEWSHEGVIHGAVAAWGETEVYHDGFRAEYARPVAFGYADSYTVGAHRAARDFAHKHGIRFLPLGELEEFASAFGEPIPEELRPERALYHSGGVIIVTTGTITSAQIAAAAVSGSTLARISEPAEKSKAEEPKIEPTLPEPIQKARRKYTRRFVSAREMRKRSGFR